jgi:secreted trypsin-like serine protease
VKQGHGHTYKVAKVVVHPRFSYDELANDIALLTPANPIDLFPAAVEAANLPSPCQNSTGCRATVAGWGRTASHSHKTAELHRLNGLPVWSEDRCKEKLKNLR